MGADAGLPDSWLDAGSETGTDSGSTVDSPPLALTEVGTLIVMGDSISSPTASWAYPALLRDALRNRYGQVAYTNVAVAGATTGDLASQRAALPSTLEGPVVIALTIAGNDFKNRAAEMLTDPVPVIEEIYKTRLERPRLLHLDNVQVFFVFRRLTSHTRGPLLSRPMEEDDLPRGA